MGNRIRILAACLALAGCSGPGNHDVDVEFIHGIVADTKIAVEQTALALVPDDPKLAARLGELVVKLDLVETQLANAIATGGPPQDAVAAIDTALGMTASLAEFFSMDPAKQARVRALAYLAQGALRIIRRRVADDGQPAGGSPPGSTPPG